MKKNKNLPDLAPETSAEKFEKEIQDDTIVLIRDNGILRIGNKKSLAGIETWTYVQQDATKKYILIDFDSTKVAPLAKGILNELSLFPELKAIRWNIVLSYILILISLLTMAASIIFAPEVEDFAKIIQKTSSGGVQKTQTTQTQQKTPQEIIQEIRERQQINNSGTGARKE